MINLEELKQYKRIHLLGIGGTSMSGIAEILKKWGFYVTGSDANDSELLEKIRQDGIPVTIGHDLDSLRKADLVVYSAAIPQDDIEMLEDLISLAVNDNVKKIEKETESKMGKFGGLSGLM